MKKQESILKRVRFIENKYGIEYQKSDGRLFKTLKIISIVLFAYILFVNLIFILSAIMNFEGEVMPKVTRNIIMNVSVLTGVFFVGFILSLTKIKIPGAIIAAVPLPLMVIIFAKELENYLGFLGFKASFYYKHAIPEVIMFLVLLWMIIILMREKIKTNRLYSKITAELYTMYHKNTEYSDEEWDKFLQNYNPRAFKEIDKGEKNN